MAQTLTVSSVLSTGVGWANGINAQTADNVYAACDLGAGGGTSGPLKLDLTSGTDPLSDVDHVIAVQCKRINDDSSTTIVNYGTCRIFAELREGSTLRATLPSMSVPFSETDRTYTLSSAEAAGIANYANLQLWLYVEVTPGDAGYGIAYVDLAKFEIPTVATPSAPTGVDASDGSHADFVRVTWTKGSGSTSSKVYRHTSNNFGAATLVASGISGKTYDDYGAPSNGDVRYYWVVAVNSAGDSSPGGPNTGYRLAVLEAPTGLSATDGTVVGAVDLAWTASSGADSYKVLRDSVVIASGITATTYSDATATPGVTYSYTVKATNSAGDSAASIADNGSAAAPDAEPEAVVQGVAATSGVFAGKVAVTWTGFEGATSYEVYRSTADFTADSAPISALATGLTETNYDDAAVAIGVTYYYAVVAVTSDGRTPMSATGTGSSAEQSVRFYRIALRGMLEAAFRGLDEVENNLGGLISSSPRLAVYALNGEYEFDPTHDTNSDLSPYQVGINLGYDGDDADEVGFADGLLSLVDATYEIASGTDPSHQLAVLVNHGSIWLVPVCIIDSFVGKPFEMRGGDTVTILWSRLLGGVFRLTHEFTPALLYPHFAEQMIGALLGGTTRTEFGAGVPTVKVNLLTESARLSSEHRYLADVPDDWYCLGKDAAVSLTNVATADVGLSAAMVDADDPVFTAPAAGLPDARWLQVYLHDADPEASLLSLLLPLPEPIVFDGTDVTIQFSATAGFWQLGEG